jgi:hypothetical protein
MMTLLTSVMTLGEPVTKRRKSNFTAKFESGSTYRSFKSIFQALSTRV